MDWNWLIGAFLILMPIANYVSFSRALRRAAERRKVRRLAQGLPAEPDTRRRWRTYTRNTAWDRYSNH